MKPNWQTKKLGEIVSIIKGRKPKAFSNTGNTPYLTARAIRGFEDFEFVSEKQLSECVIVKEDDIVIIMDGSNSGELFGGLKGVLASTMGIIKTEKEFVDSRYLMHFLLTYRDAFTKARTGSAIPHLNKVQFDSLEIPLPSLSEQKRIVKILDEAFEKLEKAKENTEKNLQNSKELFETYLETAFNSNKQKNIRSLIDIATFRNGINFTKNSKGSSVKIVGVKDFQNSFFVPFNTLDSVILNGNLNEDDLLKDGDILVVRSNGNPKLIGRSLFVKDIKDPITHSGFTIRIRLSSKDIDPKLLCYYLKSRKTRHELTESGIGINIKSLSQESLKSLSIEIPGSLSEQKQIVKKLDQLSEKTQRLETLYKQKLENIEELKRSILSKAFSKGL